MCNRSAQLSLWQVKHSHYSFMCAKQSVHLFPCAIMLKSSSTPCGNTNTVPGVCSNLRNGIGTHNSNRPSGPIIHPSLFNLTHCLQFSSETVVPENKSPALHKEYSAVDEKLTWSKTCELTGSVSHSRMVTSVEPDKMNLPSGEHDTDHISCVASEGKTNLLASFCIPKSDSMIR
jgi:hypothetical protein